MNRSTKLDLSAQPSKDKSDKAKVILAAALQVFTTHGYTAASMDRIASVSGVSKPTLYRYFQDKEGLFVALVQHLTRKNHQMLLHLQTESNLQTEPDQVLRQMATTVLEEFAHNHPLTTLMRLIIGESERFPELARTFVREIEKPLLERLTAYLASQPQLKLPDPRVAARIFAGSLMHYLLIQHVMHGGDILPLERDRMVDGLIHLIATSDKNDIS